MASSIQKFVEQCCIFVAFSLFLLENVECDILVYTQATNQIIEEFRDVPARFGSDLPENGLRVLAVQSTPSNGCGTSITPPPNVTYFTPAPPKFVALIARYNCSFEEKVRNAQNAGFDAAIVYNLGSNDLETMSANHGEDIFIPSVFVGESTGKIIIYNYVYEEGFVLVLNDEIPFNINTHLILPFAIVIGLCFIIMIVFMVVRCVRERRRMLRHRLPGSVLKKIPIIKFNKNLQYETCAICLDDYSEGEKLRVLPCHHAYHAKCIDPWLTKTRRVCPICKRKVFARGERRPPRRRRSSDDSMSSSDADESTPLLNPVDNNASAAIPNSNHTLNVMSDDDDILDDANVQDARPLIRAPQRRFNPFDRVSQQQEINDNLNEEQNATTWQKLTRLFKRAPSNLLPVEGVHSSSSSQAAATDRIEIRSPTSNNILNSNLSGSFKDENETTDDEPLGAYSDDRRLQVRSAPNLPSTSASASPRLGVAALPNINFNPNPNQSTNSRPRKQDYHNIV